MKILSPFLRGLAVIVLEYTTNVAAQSSVTEPNGFLCPTGGTAMVSFNVCAESMTVPGCPQDSQVQTSHLSDYNWASCRCESQRQYSSCMGLWCPAQATRDVLPYLSYYCELATGGSPTPVNAATITAEATATRTGTGIASGSQSGAKPGEAAILDPTLSIGAGLFAIFGILAGML